MTEQEWLASADPAAMLSAMQEGRLVAADGLLLLPALPSDRKLRLFAIPCWRGYGWRDDGNYPHELALIECAEQECDNEDYAPKVGAVWHGTVQIIVAEALHAARCWAGVDETAPELDAPQLPMRAAILRDIVGNPFRPVVREHNAASFYAGPKLLARHVTPLVLSLAQAAYEERLPDGTLDPARLAVLSDALEEEGCPGDVCETDPRHLRHKSEHTMCAECGAWVVPHPLLAHLRSPGPHYRGCHAVDLILGRE